MSVTRWGGIAHVFVGAAVALPPFALAWLFATSITTQPPGALTWWVLLLLAAATLAGIVAVAVSPPVRPAEIAVARALLGLDLPDPVVTRTRGPRLLGAAWWLVCAAIGTGVALCLLVFVPTGLGFMAFPFGHSASLVLPARLDVWQVGTGWRAWWLVPLGLVNLVVGLAALPLGARLLTRLAPVFLGPSEADLLAEAERRERAGARANHLARELHDSLGHALTAITVQADVAQRLAATDPEGAARAVAAVAETGRRTLAELDALLGALRRGEDEPVPLALDEVLDQAGRQLALHVERSGKLPDWHEPVLAAVAREALTNATRHGRQRASVVLSADADGSRLVVTNPLGLPGRADHEGGLAGMRERVRLAGGHLTAGPVGDAWVVDAALPREAP